MSNAIERLQAVGYSSKEAQQVDALVRVYGEDPDLVSFHLAQIWRKGELGFDDFRSLAGSFGPAAQILASALETSPETALQHVHAGFVAPQTLLESIKDHAATSNAVKSRLAWDTARADVWEALVVRTGLVKIADWLLARPRMAYTVIFAWVAIMAWAAIKT